MRDADARVLDRRVRERDEARLGVSDVHAPPLGAPGLAIEVDLAYTAQSLTARVEDVATRPFGVVTELGLRGKLSHTGGPSRSGAGSCVGSGRLLTAHDRRPRPPPSTQAPPHLRLA